MIKQSRLVTMMTLIAGATALLGTACDRSAEGMIDVQSAMSVTDKKGKQLVLPVGAIQSKIQVDGDKPGKQVLKIQLVNYAGNGGKDFKMELKIPANVAVPTSNGAFSVSGAQVGQAFDLAGDVSTDVRSGSQIRGSESCSWTESERVCERVQVQEPGGRCHYDTVCKDQLVTRYGEREIEYHDEYTHVHVNAQFLAPGSAALLASFAGDRDWSNRINDYTGSCRGGYRDRF